MGFLDGVSFLRPGGQEQPRDSKSGRLVPMRRCQREAARLIEEILLTHQAVIGCRDEMLSPLGLSSARAWLMKVLLRSPVRLTVSDCARRMGRARQSALDVARELERLGYVQFVHFRDDRRSAFLELTARGREACRRADDYTATWIFDVTRGFDERSLQHISGALRTIRRRTTARIDCYLP